MSEKEDKKPFNNPFAALAGLRLELPSVPLQADAETTASGRKGPPGPPKRAVVRLERVGGGRGKEVTVIGQLKLSDELLEAWLKELKSALGCGGRVEEGSLVLQGDLRQRVAQWLERKGVACSASKTHPSPST